MRRSGSSLNRPSISHELDRNLRWYALAAAGTAGIFGAGRPAECEIVYTPVHQQIAPNTTLKIDLNHDGIADFEIKDTFSTSFFSSFGNIAALPLGNQNHIWGHTVGRQNYASALFSGALIGSKGQFLPASGAMAELSFLGGKRPFASASCTEPWANVTHRYLGLQFVVSGEVYFGWARLNVSCSPNSSQIAGVLTGYAYENVAGRPIYTGKESGDRESDDPSPQIAPSVLQPASLGRLAQGAAGLSSWRKEQ